MKTVKKIAIFLFWLAVWQILSMIVNQEILLPSPASTLTALSGLFFKKRFYSAVSFSLLRIATGYILGILSGILFAVISYKSLIFRAVFSPVIKVIKSVPVASFIILAFVWFNSSVLPAFIAFLMVLPMIWTATLTGLMNIDNNYLELASVYRIGKLKTFFKIKLPLILPNLIATSLTALGFAWKSGIAAEVICRPISSLGNMLQEAKIYIEMPEVFAVTVVVVILSVILESLIKLLLRRYTND